MVYVGEPRELPVELRLFTLYGGGEGDVEVKIRVLKDTGKKTITDQYIRFCEICSEQRRIHGKAEQAMISLEIPEPDRPIYREIPKMGLHNSRKRSPRTL
ncbi:MAG: hypothetical protein HDT26_12630 [Subdoligranulum sp.]|nr:hypothetical protein [Subdoligranulum sp.]